jgi:hypothetical protein
LEAKGDMNMIDFHNSSVFKLKKTEKVPEDLNALLIAGEGVIGCYQGSRDYVAFTNKRIIAVNVQGMTGKKKDFTTLPYSKVQAYSVETAGAFDRDSELELFFSSVGKVRFEFSGASDILAIGKTIAEFVL